MTTPAIALIGAGVRGTAALGRLAARLRSAAGETVLDVHVVDPFPPGSGRIWREDQPASLVMNTVPAQSTVFDDPSLAFDAPFPGPHFAEWCAEVAAGTITGVPEAMRRLARGTAPWGFPSRALYGHYLRWAYGRFRDALPAGVRVHEHRARATGISRVDGRFRVELGAEGAFPADGVLLALGWLPRDPGNGHDLPSENPIDQPVARIAPGERVAVRGVGMGFTDLLGLVTEERGGVYSPDPEAGRRSALRYAPSGREPRLIAGSRSGAPFLAKPAFGRVPPPARLDFLGAAIPELVARRPVDFAREVLPLIERDAAAEYHRALAGLEPSAYAVEPTALLDALDAASATGCAADALPDWRALERALVPDPAKRFDPERVAAPCAASEPDALDAEIAGRIAADAAEAALGSGSPWKRALHVYQAARAAIIPVTDFGGCTEESRPALRRFLEIAGLIGSGPPLFRVEQLLAAHRAGIVRFAGAGFRVEETPRGRVATSRAAPRGRTPVDRVVDAHLGLPDPTRISDPLLDGLLASGLARLWDAGGDAAPALEITADTSALVDAAGAAVPGLHSVGPLHEELRRFTIIAPIPGARSTVLREIDAAVAALLAVAAGSPHAAEEAVRA
ncbi:FAD/NAD(P)-binding protein [Leucobacter allii]|uniref:FAD/NAD(P)-binding protein n=1 Tax=Leucobacter allii TaxID=2932247 RepID=UPI001FD4E785|nr:FAD/NAD(P)-binding protein [Leucobacter allii]UOR01088.1 FAD/NAD(P)-binding protein [Leucobacter allii]